MEQFRAALKALGAAINDGSRIPLEKPVDLTRSFEGGTVIYRRKAGEKMAVAKIEFDKRTECLPLMKAMKVMTGDQTVEWAIAHVVHSKRITPQDLADGIAALTPKERAKKEEAQIV